MPYFRHSSETDAKHQQAFQHSHDEDQDWNGMLEEEEDISFDEPADELGTYYQGSPAENRETARLISHTFDFVLSLAGVLICFLLVTVLIYLINWVSTDLSQSFTLLGAGL